MMRKLGHSTFSGQPGLLKFEESERGRRGGKGRTAMRSKRVPGTFIFSQTLTYRLILMALLYKLNVLTSNEGHYG
jgi:hypothetical protein